jgi:hypothetical protein
MTQPLSENATRQERFTFAFDHPAPGTAAAAVRAVGTITCVANASMADTDYITITDPFYGTGAAVLYEYDKAADGVTGGRTAWAVGTTAATVAANLKTAIEATQPQFSVADNGAGVLTLTYKIAGLAGNLCTITENVGDAGCTVVTFAGGADADTTGATLAVKLFTAQRRFRVDKVEYVNPTGFTQDAANYWTIALKKDATVMAQWSCLTGAEGTIAANTPVNLTLSATALNQVADAAAVISLALTKVASAANLPAGRIFVHGRYV